MRRIRTGLGWLAIAAWLLVGCGGASASGSGANSAASARASNPDDGSDDSDDDDDAPAPRKHHHESAKKKASVNGKYSGLIKVVNVPDDRGQYGDFNDYGVWGPGEWAGEMQPKGYWVYVYPNWYIWRQQGGGGSDDSAVASDSGDDDDDDADEAPKPKPKKKHHSSGGGDGAGGSASGSGQGANRDLACASAKLQATQNASCSNIASAIGGAACDCNQIAPTMWMCSTQVTCR